MNYWNQLPPNTPILCISEEHFARAAVKGSPGVRIAPCLAFDKARGELVVFTSIERPPIQITGSNEPVTADLAGEIIYMGGTDRPYLRIGCLDDGTVRKIQDALMRRRYPQAQMIP